VLVAAVLAPAIARAETVAIVVGGEPGRYEQVTGAIESWLEEKGKSIVTNALPKQQVDKLVDCMSSDAEEACARPIVVSAGVDNVLFTHIVVERQPTGDDVTLSASLFDRTGSRVSSDRRKCVVPCRVDMITTTTQELIGTLWRLSGKDVGTLNITSTPPGATVTIDGQDVGKTPLEYRVEAGPRQVELALAGHATEAKFVDVAADAVIPIDVVLVAKPDGGPVTTSKPAWRENLPWIVIGSGGALFATGVVLFFLDEDQPGPMEDREPTYTDTILPATVFGVLGAGAIATGIYLYMRDKREGASGPVVEVDGRGGATIGWRGSFR
jgi:hypothetical protein